MIDIYIDSKKIATVPIDNVKHKDFNAILMMYLNNIEWKKFELRRIDNGK